MQYVAVCLVAFAGGAFTLYSGFGLTVILLPVLARYFPAHIALAAVAIVHLADNIAKATLVGRKANLMAVMLFGLPAAIGGLFGSICTRYVMDIPPVARYVLGDQRHEITATDLVTAALLIAAAVVAILPVSYRVFLNLGYLPVGGAVAGFLGGLSGQYGALRAAYLVNAGLSREAFIATSVLAAVALDASRIAVYGFSYVMLGIESLPQGGIGLVTAAILSAAAGSWFGSRHMKAVPLEGVHTAAAALLILVGLALASGLL